MRGSRIFFITCLALLGSPVSGVNLVSNGDFSDSAQITGWTVGFGSMTWWPVDATGQSDSGSMRLENPFVQAVQCFHVGEGSYLVGGATAFLVAATGARAELRLRFASDEGCTGFVTTDTPVITWTSPLNDWDEETFGFQSPPDRPYLTLILALTDDGDAIAAHFDDVWVEVDSNVVFTDGFGSGDTSGWSQSIP